MSNYYMRAPCRRPLRAGGARSASVSPG
jgi:hypothetical protein